MHVSLGLLALSSQVAGNGCVGDVTFAAARRIATIESAQAVGLFFGGQSQLPDAVGAGAGGEVVLIESVRANATVEVLYRNATGAVGLAQYGEKVVVAASSANKITALAVHEKAIDIDDDATLASAVFADDLNGDEFEDLVATVLGSNSIFWYNGADALDKRLITSSCDECRDLVVSDLDQDGDADVVVESLCLLSESSTYIAPLYPRRLFHRRKASCGSKMTETKSLRNTTSA